MTRGDLITVAGLAIVVVAGLVLVGQAGGPDGLPPPTTVERSIDQVRPGDGPVLGEPVGLVLAVGAIDTEILVVDLDSGAVWPLGQRGRPELIVDGLVIVDEGAGTWGLVDIDSGAGADLAPDALTAPITAVVPAVAGGVWLRHDEDGGGRRWSRVSINGVDAIEVVEVVTVPRGSDTVTDAAGRPLAGPEVIGSDAGVISVLGSSGHEPVLDGSLVAVGPNTLVVAACDQAGCANAWVDRATLQPLDHPPLTALLGSGFLANDTTLVVETVTNDGTNPIVKVFDVVHGTAITTGSPSGLARTWVSPAGRFVAVPGFDALLITDLEARRTATLHRLRVDAGVHVAWGRRP
ncbi:MAG: hypothetical protein AAF467_08995 [Actinomycetota bacterium]